MAERHHAAGAGGDDAGARAQAVERRRRSNARFAPAVVSPGGRPSPSARVRVVSGVDVRSGAGSCGRAARRRRAASPRTPLRATSRTLRSRRARARGLPPPSRLRRRCASSSRAERVPRMAGARPDGERRDNRRGERAEQNAPVHPDRVEPREARRREHGREPVSSIQPTAVRARRRRTTAAPLSVSSWRARRPRLAPIAARIASSRWRATPRDRNRFATFAQAMSRTSTTPAASTSERRSHLRADISPTRV